MEAMSAMVHFSIGCNCAATANIRRAFGTDRSFPLDWTLTPITAATALFDAGLDQEIHAENLEVSKWGGSIVNRKFGLRYVHDFDMSGDWQAQIPEVARKYKARTERMIEALQAGPATLWFNTEPETNFTPAEREQMKDPALQAQLRDAVHRRFPLATLHFIAPEIRETGGGWAGDPQAWDEAFGISPA